LQTPLLDYETLSQNTSMLVSDVDIASMKTCWRIQDCGHCLVSKENCGWCPYSATCVPLPKGGNILSPIRNKHICPLPWQERWELRTAPFGCNCSTTSFLVSMGTVLGTIFALILLYLLYKLIKWMTLAAKREKEWLGITC